MNLKKDSPWDVQTSAPPPLKHQLEMNNWEGRPILHPDHAHDLESSAAINEFKHKLPRAQAEDAAYAEYKQKNRKEASAHHFLGMKAAAAAGDFESARKHGMMYDLHSKALGHEAVGPLHPDVMAHINSKPSNVYKFKPHKGDAFAVTDHEPEEFHHEGTISSAPPPVKKSETLEVLYGLARCVEMLAKGNKPDKEYCAACRDPLDKDGHCTVQSHWAALDAKKSEQMKEKVIPCRCPAYDFPHRTKSHPSCTGEK